jgi:ABC-type nitrate/sulfonate/bicarbonate transport system ATPase subunit
MDPVAIRVSGARKAYHRGHAEHPVFDDLSLEVRRGEVLVLLGPSGCGKSTLLRVLSGLETLDRGTVEVAGARRTGEATGICFQQPSLLPWLTVAENVGLGLRFAANRAALAAPSAGGGGARDRVARLLDELGLADVADAYPGEVSGGQAQRANVARVVATGRPILLLDEPFAALDPGTRASLQDWLLALRASLGLTVVLVTHDVEEAVRVGDRVVLLSGTPSTARRTWDVTAVASRHDHGSRLDALRREILGHYDTHAPARAAA